MIKAKDKNWSHSVKPRHNFGSIKWNEREKIDKKHGYVENLKYNCQQQKTHTHTERLLS